MIQRVPYSFPNRLEPLKTYAAQFGIRLRRSRFQEERYIIRKKGEKKFLYAQNLDIAAALIEDLITEYPVDDKKAKIHTLVQEHFGDSLDTMMWFETELSEFGGLTPTQMIEQNQHDILLEYVTNSLS